MKSGRVRRIAALAFVVIGLSAGAIWAWRHAQTLSAVRQAALDVPDLTGYPAGLGEEIASARTEVQGLFHAQAGLAHLAQLYHANGFYDDALRCYRTLAAVAPSDPRWPHLLAAIESANGRVETALPWQERAVALAPDNAVVRLRFADMQLKLDRLAAAAQEYRRLLQQAPDNAYALLGLARCRLREGDEAGARDALTHATRAQPNLVTAWALLSTLEDRQGRPAAAQAARGQSRGRFRDLEDPWVDGLADYCYDGYQLSVTADLKSSDPARAQQLLERAIAVAPSVSSYHRQLAKLLIKRDPKSARMHLERAVALSPTDSESWSALITLLLDTKEREAAYAALARALRQCPESGYLHFLNGSRLMALGQNASAEQAFLTAKRLQPSEIRAYVQLSILYVTTGNTAAALKEVQAANAVDPGNPAVINLLARLAIMTDDRAAAATWIARLRGTPNVSSHDVEQLEGMFAERFGH